MYRLIIDGQYVPIPPEKISIKVDGDNKPMSTLRSIRNFYLPRRHLNWRFTDMLQIIKKYSILFLKCRWKDLQ